MYDIPILFPRAVDGREEAVYALSAAGASVDVLPLYRSVALPADHPMLARGLQKVRAGRVQALGFFAPSHVDALFAALGADADAIVRACPVIAAIGRTTAAALTRRGVDVHVVPSRPDAEQLVRDIAECWRQRSGHSPV